MGESDDFELITSLRYDQELVQSQQNALFSPGHEPSPFYMLSYHYDRLVAAAKGFGWEDAANKLENLESFRDLLVLELEKHQETQAKDARSGPLKIRFAIARPSTFSTSFAPADPLPAMHFFPKELDALFQAAAEEPKHVASESNGTGSGKLWEIIADTQTTSPSNFTRHKTSRRHMYNSAWNRVKPNPEPKSSQATGSATDGAQSGESDVMIYNSNGDIMETGRCTVYFKRDGGWTTPPLSAGGQEGTTRRWALHNELCIERNIDLKTVREGEEVCVSNGVRGFHPGSIVCHQAGTR